MVTWAAEGGSLLLVRNDGGLFAWLECTDGTVLLEDLDYPDRVVTTEELDSLECRASRDEIIKALQYAATKNQEVCDGLRCEESDIRLERKLLEDYYLSTRGV